MEQVKICTRCKLSKPLTEYHKGGRKPGGKASHCKACQADQDRKPAYRYSRFRSKLRSTEGKELLLTLEEWTALSGRSCHYCRRPVATSGSGLDRLDAGGEYVLSNVVPSCGTCNSFKGGALTPSEMLTEIGPALARIQARREASGLPLIENAMPRSARFRQMPKR